MMRTFSTILLLAVAVAFTACSSSNSNNANGNNNATAIPNIAGPWEFRLVSSNNTQTGVDVALQEGKALNNGAFQPNGSISASGAQIILVSFSTSSGLVDSFEAANCPGTGTNSISGAISALGGNVSNFTVMENGNTFNISAALSGDGQSMIGTYQSASPTNCQDSGTFTAAVVPKLPSLTYAGTLTLPSCPTGVTGCDTVNASLSENSSNVATLSLKLSGTDNEALTLTGPVTGNAFTVQGTFQGQMLVLYGYYESKSNSPALYLANASNPSESAGVLTESQP